MLTKVVRRIIGVDFMKNVRFVPVRMIPVSQAMSQRSYIELATERNAGFD